MSSVGTYLVEGTMAAWVDPHVIYDLYQVPRDYQSSSTQNSQAVVAFEKQWISMDDLKEFYQLNGLAYDPSLIEIVGPNNSSQPGGESTLDITVRQEQNHMLCANQRRLPTVHFFGWSQC